MGRPTKEQIKERERLAELGLKQCSKEAGCGKIKPVDDFALKEDRWDNRRSVCILCDRANRNQYYKDNPEVGAAYYQENKEEIRQYRLDNIEKQRTYGRKSYAKKQQEDPMHYRLKKGQPRAKKAGVECDDFSSTDLLNYWQLNNISVDTCHYCKQAIDEDELEIDHGQPIIRGGGHVLDNLYPSHRKCNRQKGDMTAEEYLEHRASL